MVRENEQAWSDEDRPEGIKATAERLTQTARERVSRAAEQGKGLAAGKAEEGKGWAADELGHFSSALHCAADRLREENDAKVAGYAEGVAERIDQAADYLRGRSAGDLFNEACAISRRNPELVLGGMFIAGLALARFLKASARTQGSSGDWNPQEVWSNEGGAVAEAGLSPETGSGYTDL